MVRWQCESVKRIRLSIVRHCAKAKIHEVPRKATTEAQRGKAATESHQQVTSKRFGTGTARQRHRGPQRCTQKPKQNRRETFILLRPPLGFSLPLCYRSLRSPYPPTRT